jgi:hypothetical protein
VPQNRTLRGRFAGQSAMAAVVAAQSHRVPQRSVARLFGVSPLTAQGKVDHRDAVGQLHVGSILDRLHLGWDVLHGLPLGALSLDHFAVGRAGVFAFVDVNCQGREATIDGDLLIVGRASSGRIVDARASAAIVAGALSVALNSVVTATAVLVLVQPTKVTTVQKPHDVEVLTSLQLEQWLLSVPLVLAGEDVAQISGVAEADSTWPQPQDAAGRARNLRRAFRCIQHNVRAASLRKGVWITATVVVALPALAYLVSMLMSMSMS